MSGCELESAVMGKLTPWKLANATKQDFFPGRPPLTRLPHAAAQGPPLALADWFTRLALTLTDVPRALLQVLGAVISKNSSASSSLLSPGPWGEHATFAPCTSWKRPDCEQQGQKSDKER